MKFQSGSKRRLRKGFTLLDVIAATIVLGIMAILASPMLTRSMADARSRVCADNLGQVGRAVARYSSDHDEMFPGNQHSPPAWTVSLANYSNTNIFRCPDEILGDARAVTIALNDFLTPKPYGSRQIDFSKRLTIPAPHETLMFAEADESYRAYDHFHFADTRENGHTPEAFSDQVDVNRHSGEANYLFADGGVSALAWSSAAKPKLNARGSKFVHPSGGSRVTDLATR